MYYYSPTTKGFYTKEIHGSNIPSDSVEVSEQEHSILMNGQLEGKEITSNKNEKPFLIDRQEQPLTWKTIRKQRDFLLKESDWVGLSDINLPEVTLNKWKNYRQALRDIPQKFTLPGTVIWPLKP